MEKLAKKPSDASIRRALTVLKKAEIIDIQAAVNMELDDVATVARIPIRFLSPKKTTKKRIPKQRKPIKEEIYDIKD